MATRNATETSELIPANKNNGWTYRQVLTKKDDGKSLLEILSSSYKHSSWLEWSERLKQGQLRLNNSTIKMNKNLTMGDLVTWERPPWIEDAVPARWETLFDNNDILIINKPAGLPVVPGGGFLKHTLTELLSLQFQSADKTSIPRPVHRLGRFTSGLLVCARQKDSRAKLSALFRDRSSGKSTLQKIYRALAEINPILELKVPIEVNIPISKYPHPLVGTVWNAADSQPNEIKDSSTIYSKLEAYSTIKLLERCKEADLLEVNIRTGRPHQIRIHLAAIGSALIGDTLYKKYGKISPCSTPGKGGYLLHAHKLKNIPIGNDFLCFEAKPPEKLKMEAGTIL